MSGGYGTGKFAELMAPAGARDPAVVGTPNERDSTAWAGRVRDIGLLVLLRDRTAAA